MTRSLPPCRRTPNCVSTQTKDPDQFMEPILYSGPLAAARERLLAVLRALPRTRIVLEEPDYLKAECRSRVFRFVDDVEKHQASDGPPRGRPAPPRGAANNVSVGAISFRHRSWCGHRPNG